MKSSIRLPNVPAWVVAALAIGACPAASAAVGDALDRVGDHLVLASDDGLLHAELAGSVAVELYYVDQIAGGILFADPDDTVFWAPRLTLDLDVAAGSHLSVFARGRFDRGVDPGLAKDGEARIDVAVLRVQAAEQFVQVGKFSSVFGSWLRYQDSEANVFVTPPAVYENFHIVSDRLVPADTDAWLMWRNTPVDVRKKWLPTLWGLSYAFGANAGGQLGIVDYVAAVNARSPSSRPNEWDSLDTDLPVYTVRVGASPDPSTRVGVSASRGPFLVPEVTDLPAGSGPEDYDQTLIGLDADWSHGHLRLQAEYIWSEFEVPNVGDVDTSAWYVAARYRLRPRWTTGLRWNVQSFGHVTRGDGSRQRWDRNQTRVDLSATWDLDRHTRTTLQYSHTDQEGGLEQGENAAVLRVAVWF